MSINLEKTKGWIWRVLQGTGLVAVAAAVFFIPIDVQGGRMTMTAASDFGVQFYPVLKEYLIARIEKFPSIPPDRKSDLEKIAKYVRERIANSLPAKLTFICTHNSRRSHLSQIWAQVASEYYGLTGVETYSGGTEATAFNPRAVAAMRRL